jgi:hypothetical protein
MKKKMLFMSLLLLLFATYSCAIEELQPETTPISSEILNNVNPEFLEHDLSVYKIKPIWKSAIVFKSSSAANKKTKFNEAVEVNFTQDNKTTIPISKNGKIRGRQRLLLTFEDGKIRETIIEYIPSDSFMGDIKTINSGNFKSKQFDGKIMFHNPNEETKIVWYLTKGKVVKKAKSSPKKTKPSKTARYVSVYSCHTYEVCVGSGGEEVCNAHTTCSWEEVWEEDDPGNGNPPVDPYDCGVDPSWPWCQEACNDCGDGSGGEGNQPNTIVIVAPDYPIQDIIDYLKCFDKNQGAKITFYADQPVAGSSQANTITADVGHAFITIEQNGNRMTLGFYPASGGIATINSVFVPVNGVMGDDTNHHYDVSLSVNVSGSILTNILNESVNYADKIYNINTDNCSDFSISVANIAGLNISECNGSFGLGIFGSGSNPGAFGEELRNLPLSAGMTKDTDGGSAPQNIKNCN